MIWRHTPTQEGAQQAINKFAWWPVRFTYKAERITVWLGRYRAEQTWFNSYAGCPRSHFMLIRGPHWCTSRRLTLSDAALEKLNPVAPAAPQPQPSTSQLGASAMQQLLAQQGLQNQLNQQQLQAYQQARLGGLGGTP